MLESLAINRPQWISVGSQHLVLPSQGEGLDLQLRNPLQNTHKARFARHFVLPAPLIIPAMQRSALWPRQIPGVAGNASVAADHPGHFRTSCNRQNRRDTMALALALAKLRHLRKVLSQGSQRPGRKFTAPLNWLFIRLQPLG